MRAAPALALAVLALAAACQDPKGRCDTSADCASNERCDAGVCVRFAPPGGDGAGGGSDPATFTPVLWSTLAESATAAFAPASLSVDAATGDVLVSGDAGARFDPWDLATGFAARWTGATGALARVVSFPTFSRGDLRTAALPGGAILFAGRAEAPTTFPAAYVPTTAGSLFVGRLTAAGDPVWVVTVDGTNPAVPIAPIAVLARGPDLVVIGAGAGDFGHGDTAGATFAADLDAATGAWRWSRGFDTRTLSDAEALPSGEVAVAGLCTPTGASFVLGDASCTGGMFVTVLGGDTGNPVWTRVSGGSGAVTAVRDVAVAAGLVAVVGDARGAVSFAGGAETDFGALDGSFVKLFTGAGAEGPLIRPVEAPTAALRDALAFDRCAFDASARLWIAGRYDGQPTLAGVRFPRCRDTCAAAAFLARVDAPAAAPATGSLLPIRIAAASGTAYADGLVLAASAGSVALSLRFSGDATVGANRWTTAGAGLGTLRVVP